MKANLWAAAETQEEPRDKEVNVGLTWPDRQPRDPRGEQRILRVREGGVAEALCAVAHLVPELPLEQPGDEAVEAVLRGGQHRHRGRRGVQLGGVHAGAVGPAEHDLAEVQAGNGGGRGTGDVAHQLVALHPLLQPLQGAAALPGVLEEVEAPQEVHGLEDGEGQRGEVVAVEVKGDQAGEILKGALLNGEQAVSVQVEDLQLHQVTEPGLGHVGQQVPSEVERLEAGEALEGVPGQVRQQVVIEVEVLQPQQVLEGLVMDDVYAVLLKVQVPVKFHFKFTGFRRYNYI